MSPSLRASPHRPTDEQPTYRQPTGSPTPEAPTPDPTTSQPPTGGSDRSRQRHQTDPGRRLAGQEDRQEGGSAVRRQDIFLGQSLQIQPSTNPGQLCDACHRDIAEGTSNGKFQDPKDVDLGTTKLKAATCLAQVTVQRGQGSTKLYLFSLVSVRRATV